MKNELRRPLVMAVTNIQRNGLATYQLEILDQP